MMWLDQENDVFDDDHQQQQRKEEVEEEVKEGSDSPSPFAVTPAFRDNNNIINSGIGATLPVDRFWIQKLLEKHGYSSGSEDKSNIFFNKGLVLAPMVDQSDLAFRVLCRKYGANITFTPMIHSKLYTKSPMYRQKFSFPPNEGYYSPRVDRPCIAQICGSDPTTMLRCAMDLQNSGYVDGIDINCGCPQNIAKRGNYGAYLLEQKDTLLNAVRHLTTHLSIPVSVKVRLLPDQSETLDLMKALVYEGGIHLLTVHGRTRHQKGYNTGPSDWYRIREIVDLLGDKIPIFANGSISTVYDVYECLNITNADGIMSSEAILEYPALFYPIHLYNQQQMNNNNNNHNNEISSYQHYQNIVSSQNSYSQKIGQIQLAQQYLHSVHDFTNPQEQTEQGEQTEQDDETTTSKHVMTTKRKLLYPPNVYGQGSGLKCIRIHIHRMLHYELSFHANLRTIVATTKNIYDIFQAVTTIYQHQLERCATSTSRENIAVTLQNYVQTHERLSWYMRHRMYEMDSIFQNINYSTNHRAFTRDNEERNHDESKDSHNHTTSTTMIPGSSIQSYNLTIVVDPTGKPIDNHFIFRNNNVILDGSKDSSTDSKIITMSRQAEMRKQEFKKFEIQEDAAECMNKLFGSSGDDDDSGDY